MYEDHFGLNKRPFRALATGSDVFVGPQTAATVAALKKGLTTPDAVVAVSGPVGVGKTTLVRRALDTLCTNAVVISLGRIQLGHDEVLELLLEELGAQPPSGTVQRFTKFRRLLKEHAEKGTRIFVVVEDATRVGADALSELEALTASDAGVSDGANVVLMGDEDMNEVLKSPRLARLKQRLRLRHRISPLSTGELTGYLKHCFRLAGNEFDLLFEPGTSDVLHALTGGLPRMTNNLVESVLTSAADTKQDRIGVALIKLVATEEYGLEPARDAAAVPSVAEIPDEGAPVEATPLEAPPVEETPIELPAVAEAQAEVVSMAEPLVEAAPVAEAAVELPPVARVPDGTEPALPVLTNIEPPFEHPEVEAPPAVEDNDANDAIPELIQDTLPDLAILAPALAESAMYDQAPPRDPLDLPDAVKESANEDIPTLSSAEELAMASTPVVTEPDPNLAAALEAAQVGSSAEEIPEWERDPTLAELRPDLDALEHAMAVAQGLEPDQDSDEQKAAGDTSAEADEPVPEITLDREIQAKIEEATELLKQAEQEAEEQAEPEVDDSSKRDKPISEILAQASDNAASQESQSSQSIEAQFEAAEIPVAPVAEPAAASIAEPVAAPAETVAEETPATDKTPDENSKAQPPMPNPELRQIAANISRAKTLDDVDDEMAETLFGEEFSLIAAQIAANVQPELSANDDLELALEESASVPAVDMESAAAVEIEIEAKPTAASGHIDLAATQQRLATVRALNAAPKSVSKPALFEHENVVMSENYAASEAPPANDHPESIEEQINTSITQTLKALSVRPPPTSDDDDDEDERKGKGGFFKRFRRS